VAAVYAVNSSRWRIKSQYAHSSAARSCRVVSAVFELTRGCILIVSLAARLLLRDCYDDESCIRLKTPIMQRVAILLAVLLAMFSLVLAGTSCPKRTSHSVAYIESTSYGWPFPWLTLNVEDTAERAFYENKPVPPPKDCKRITHIQIDWQTFSIAGSLSAVIAGIAGLPFFVWCRRNRPIIQFCDTTAAEPKGMFARGKARWLLILWTLVGAFTVFGIWMWSYVHGCSREGTRDFEALENGTRLLFAKRCCCITDGGSVVYRGRGYEVVSVHRLIEVEGQEGKYGHLIGAELRWRMPVQMFRRDAQSYWLVKPPSTNESKASWAIERRAEAVVGKDPAVDHLEDQPQP
jgi:hypothetical protein